MKNNIKTNMNNDLLTLGFGGNMNKDLLTLGFAGKEVGRNRKRGVGRLYSSDYRVDYSLMSPLTREFMEKQRIIQLNRAKEEKLLRLKNSEMLRTDETSLHNKVLSSLLLNSGFNTLLQFRLANLKTMVNRVMFSTKKHNQNFLCNLLENMNLTNYNNDENTQRDIETSLYNSYEEIFLERKGESVIIAGINRHLLGGIVHKYILSKQEELNVYIESLNNFDKDKTYTKPEDSLKKEILSLLDKGFIFNLCLVKFLQIYTHQNSENDKDYVLVPILVGLGKRMVSQYLNVKKDSYNTENDKKLLYSEYREIWNENNPQFRDLLDDTIYAQLGGCIVDILCHCSMISRELRRIQGGGKKQEYILNVVQDELLDSKKVNSIFNLPSKLPMVCEPRKYSKGNVGGYLLNDEKYHEELFIDKKAYGSCSELSNNNGIYDMVNGMISTPYKVNKDLLDYINNKGVEQGLLMDLEAKHELESLDYLKTHQRRKLASYTSKKILQETILGIATMYSKFPKFYFPVRLDQRGRVYCSPNYFNYQSNELAKSLLLFATPSIIQKTDDEVIKYLYYYGVNCFGGRISKQSNIKKGEWIKKNHMDILEFSNGILLSKAQDKLLFLSFCIEYKRYCEFMENENSMEFLTYLPIQLDATCNGFQHMALLSNEDTLFKELNLVKKEEKDKVPSDFYNFLLHKLLNTFKEKVDQNVLTDTPNGGSYERLTKFMWERSNIKKAVMTIPYNASNQAMVGYIKDSLIVVDCKKDDVSWYSDSEKNKKPCINDKDVSLLVASLRNVITNDFQKIKKLTSYLTNVTRLLNMLELPVTWTLPTGLTVKQSYLETKSTTISPFMFSSTRISLNSTVKDKLDHRKQIRSLMPNLIHSLDATSMSLLHKQFVNHFEANSPQLFSIHDCFGTTCDKVFVLKTILASVYTELYSDKQYLVMFDKCVLDNISYNTNYKLDRENRILYLPDREYTIADINWVVNDKKLSSLEKKRISMQHILI